MKQLLFILLLFYAVDSIAQKKISVGTAFGVGKTYIQTPYHQTGDITYRFGVLTDIKITGAFCARVEANFDSYAMSTSEKHTDAQGYLEWERKNITRMNSFDIPIMMKLQTGVKANPYYCLGVGPSFLISAKNFDRVLRSSVSNIEESPAKTDVSNYYNSVYWSLYNIAGIELKGSKIIPFIEFRYKHSLNDINDEIGYGALNTLTGSIGFKF